MKKKNDDKKKRCRKAARLLPKIFLSVSHNTASCIVTQRLTGMAWACSKGAGVRSRRAARAQQGRRGAHGERKGRLGGAQGLPRYGRLGHDTGHDMAKGGHDTTSSARGLFGGLCRDTHFCIVTEVRGLAIGGLCHDTVFVS